VISGAFWVLTLAVVVGSALALWHLRAAEGGARPPVAAGLTHGVIGTIGLGMLLVALRGPPRGVGAGVGSFGTVSAVLFAGALLSGIVMLLLRRRGLLIAIHAGIAISGYVLVLAWDALG
jgi:hypothetical protein